MNEIIASEGFSFSHWIWNLQKIPVKLCPRRPGDATEVYASTQRAETELGWK